jgi:hypothetical protein
MRHARVLALARAGAAGSALLSMFACAAGAAAQPVDACAPRPALAAAFDVTGTNVRLSAQAVPPSPQGEARLTRGAGGWAAGEVPLSPAFSIRIEAARSQLPVGPAPGAAVHAAGDARRSQVLGGLVYRPGPGRRVCGYMAAAAGWQRVSLGGFQAGGVEIAGNVGIIVRAASRLHVFVEAGLAGANTASAAPLNAELLLSGRLLAGLRYPF